MSALPVPLNALRAIEIVARTGSLKPAAEELGVTIGAVSQHLRRAEARLGVELFERLPTGLRPTPQLEAARPMLSAGFASLEDASRALQRSDDHIIRLTLGNMFASCWLINRLPHLAARYPELELHMVATGKLVDLAHSNVDCAIRLGAGAWPGNDARPLNARSFRPVCAPALAQRLKHPSDLGKVPVIEDRATMFAWSDWFAAAKLAPLALSGPIHTDPSLAFSACVAGQGVMMVNDLISADARAEGRLVDPFGVGALGNNDYFFVTPAGRRLPKKVVQFRDWLWEELAK